MVRAPLYSKVTVIGWNKWPANGIEKKRDAVLKSCALDYFLSFIFAFNFAVISIGIL